MNKVCLIGNSGTKRNVLDGQTEKVRLYARKIVEEGNKLFFVELEHFLKHPVKILRLIKKGIKECDRIVLLSAERGSKILIPYILRHNKLKKPFILPLIGSSVLHYSIDHLSETQKNQFFDGNYGLTKAPKVLSKQLNRITKILPETDLLSKTFINFYKLSNVATLNNFRDLRPFDKTEIPRFDFLRVIYVSRVMREKGIFDLINVINNINTTNKFLPIELDIFGIKEFSRADEKLFSNLLSEKIRYFGQVENKKIIQLISKYDLFVFPTKFMGEGTPGVITESLLASTPILTSSFPQAIFLLKDGFDSIFFEINNTTDLRNKLIWCLQNKDTLYNMRNNVLESSKRFSYSYNREIFCKYICGETE